MSFKAGDRVVYPHHGAAVVEKKEKITAFGEERDYLVLRMAHGEMTLRVPVDSVDDVGMRWPISGDDVDDLELLALSVTDARRLISVVEQALNEPLAARA